MGQGSEVAKTFEANGLMDALRWAWRSAASHAYDEHNPEVGHTLANLGLNAHNQLKDRIERVGQTGAYRLPTVDDADDTPDRLPSGEDVLHAGLDRDEIISMIALDPGAIVRCDFNGSPGFRMGNYLVLMQSHPLGQVQDIRWSQKSATKQRAASQGDPDQYALFDDIHSDAPESGDDLRVLVLAHAIDPDTGRPELHLGQPSMNEHDESPWYWLFEIRDDLPRPNAGTHSDDTPAIDPNEGVPDATVKRRMQSEERVS